MTDPPSQVAKAVQALHQAGILHGELRPENILLVVLPSHKSSDEERSFRGSRGSSSNHSSGRLLDAMSASANNANARMMALANAMAWPSVPRGSPMSRQSPASSVIRGSPASSSYMQGSSGGRVDGNQHGLEVWGAAVWTEMCMSQCEVEGHFQGQVSGRR